jgi:putative N6-adenine-specific DNA methylase
MAEPLLDLYSTTAPGLEPITAGEIGILHGCAVKQSRGGVAWQGHLGDVYRANLWLRTASRVLVRVAEFHAGTFAELERRASRLPWGRFVRARDRVRFRVTCHKSALYHSDAVAQRLMEQVVAATGCPSGPYEEGGPEWLEGSGGEQLFVVVIDHDVVTLSADSSGALLHRRGYRLATAKAPMRETIASAMLLASGWTPEQPLLDPLCGSGTIPIEAALIARNIAPGFRREFRFQRWPGFAAQTWTELLAGAAAGVRESVPSTIVGSDRDPGAVAASLANSERAGVSADTQFVQCSLSASGEIVGGSDAGAAGWVMTNPPYGVRIGTDVRNLYARIGSLLREELRGWSLGILIAVPELERQLKLHLEQTFETSNGGIPIKFMTRKATP